MANNLMEMFRPQPVYTPTDAMRDVGNAKNALASGQLTSMKANALGQEMADNEAINQVMTANGGDLNSAMQDPNLNWKAKQQIGGMISEQNKAQADSQMKRVESQIKNWQYAGNRVGSAQSQEEWDAAREEVRLVLGDDFAKNLPEQWSPEVAQKLGDAAMTHAEKIAQQREERQANYQNQSLDLQERRLQNAEARASGGDSQQKAPTGYQFQQDGSLAPIKGGPADRQSGADKTQLSSQAQKELFEADDMINAGNNIVTAIDTAMQYNDKAYSGIGASQLAFARSQLGDDPAANATIQMDNIIKDLALSSMKAIFGGNPTEGERAILLDLQASTEKTPSQRAEILGRAKQAAIRRMDINKQKAQALRSGTYFNAAPEDVQQTAQPADDNIDDLLEMYK